MKAKAKNSLSCMKHKKIWNYSLITYIIILLSSWGLRAIWQEIMYQIRYLTLLYVPLLCLVWIFTFLTVTGLVSETLAWLHERTDSYIPVVIAIGAIAMSFALSVQPSPEERNFYRYQDDYEEIVQLWREGIITEDTPIERCLGTRRGRTNTIQIRLYCLWTGHPLTTDGIIFFLNDSQIILLFTQQEISNFTQHPCETVYPAGGRFQAQIDEHWSVCWLSIR